MKNLHDKKPQKPSKRFTYEPIDWDAVEDLGKKPDTVIAQRFGVSPASVRAARLSRGIQANRRYITGSWREKIRKWWEMTAGWDWAMTDVALSELSAHNSPPGVSPTTVREIRRALGIPPRAELKGRKENADRKAQQAK